MLYHFLQLAPPLFVAIILHEVAHGWMAERLGDPTARDAGRISLNPLVHIDPFMTLILPTILILSGSPVVFGGAKPVPVRAGYFKNPERGMMFVAAAGPIANFILAGLCLFLARVIASSALLNTDGFASVLLLPMYWIVYGFFINLMLGVFNLIPIPPLDGGRVVSAILPASLRYWYAKTERHGLLILVVVLYFHLLDPVFEYVQIYAEQLLLNTSGKNL